MSLDDFRSWCDSLLGWQFRTYPVNDGRGGKPLPFVLCDTMGLEEQSGAGLDIEDINSILQGHVPDRYKVRVLISRMNEGWSRNYVCFMVNPLDLV